MSGEFERIARLAAMFGAHGRQAAGVTVGIGDDAAVLEPPAGQRLLWTVDEQVEGTHFTRELLSWTDLGWRSLIAAASDVAAMGGSAWCVLAALTLDDHVSDQALDELGRGQALAAMAIGARVVGGNLARGPHVAVTTTVLGTAGHVLTRAGARPGDGLWIAGDVGLAAAGLALLRQGAAEAGDPHLVRAVQAWRRPAPRFDVVAELASAHAALDVSDGLAQDVGHLARASSVCALLDEAVLREHAGTVGLDRCCAVAGLDVLDVVLGGGEDYALAAAADHPLPGFWRAGTFREGEGVRLVGPGGERDLPPAGLGFQHFR